MEPLKKFMNESLSTRDIKSQYSKEIDQLLKFYELNSVNNVEEVAQLREWYGDDLPAKMAKELKDPSLAELDVDEMLDNKKIFLKIQKWVMDASKARQKEADKIEKQFEKTFPALKAVGVSNDDSFLNIWKISKGGKNGAKIYTTSYDYFDKQKITPEQVDEIKTFIQMRKIALKK